MSFFLLSGGAEVIDQVRAEYNLETNPDLYQRVYMHFGIDDARELIERAATRAIQAPHRTFIIVTPVITVEAQNALLKTIEEPPAGAHFYFIVPNPDTLLPTVRSRATVGAEGFLRPMRAQKPSAPTVAAAGSTSLRAHTGRSSEVLPAAAFLAATPARRIEMLKPLLEKNDDEGRDVGAILAFLAELEVLVGAGESLHVIYRTRKYITDKGALVKPLLESVALLV